MYLKAHLTIAVVATLWAISSAQSTQEPVRFSRLLSKQPDILRFSSISNLGPAAPVLQQIQPAAADEAPVAVVPTTNKKASLGSRQFLHRAAPVDDDAVLITRAQPGEEYVFIQSNIKSDDSDSSSITTINQKPSARKPLALLRQSSGNKLNISPVFPDNAKAIAAAIRPNGNNQQVSILSGNDSQDDINEATTPAPVYDEYYEDGTTENSQQYDDLPATTQPPTVQQEKKGRMIINVVTSAPRFEVENRNSTTAVPVISSTSAPVTVAAPAAKSVEENLVVDAFHRSGHFPDFEDSPAHLHTAESNQPARVNVRPASSGKDYEYEYIYYYYDDEDEDNSTAKKTDSSSTSADVGAVNLPQGAADVSSFEADKIAVANPPTNSLDAADSRFPKSYQEPAVAASIPELPESLSDEQLQATTAPSEILRTNRPNSVNRPVILKQSNLAPTGPSAPAEIPVTTTERQRNIPERRTTTTTTTTAAPSSESPRTRLRNKSRLDGGNTNQFTRTTTTTTQEPVVVESEAPARRAPPKDLLRRRNPGRRLQTTEAPAAVEDQAEEQAAPVPTERQQQPAVRLPPRPRFPPRQQSSIAPAAETTVPEAVPTQVAVQETAVPYETQAVTAEVEKKAKDNFARQKSINDLYALTRLHQLAINTRVPNRKPDPHSKAVAPKVAAGLANSAEQTTRYPEDSNEATTISSLHHSNEQVELTVQPTTTTTTTTEASLPQRPGLPGRRNRFRPRGQRVNPAPATEETVSTTEAAAVNRVPSSPNRFGSRRRLQQASTTSTTEAPQVEGDRTTEARPTTSRQPTRNRFAGRTRPTTSTTEATVAADQQQETESQPPRRRPGFQARRRNQQLQQAPASESTDESSPATPASAPTTTAAAAQPRRNSGGDSERRRFNFGNPARNRPSGPGSRPAPLRIRGSSTTEAPEVVPEVQEPIVSEQVSVSEGEVREEQSVVSDQEPVVSVSSTTSSSVSSDVIVNKVGSAGVLGRLRLRSKPVSTTTTAAPELQSVNRKPSRLNGILNRRKLGGSTTTAPDHEEIHEEPQESQNQHEENEAAPQHKGVVVQISSTVTESEEIGHPEDHSSTTQVSILNRFKSQRKPGQIYRKSTVTSSE